MDGLEYHFEGKQVNDLMVKTFTRMFAGLSVTACGDGGTCPCSWRCRSYRYDQHFL